MIDSFTKEYRFLSNFWPSKVKFCDMDFPSVECAYQAAKCADPKHRIQFVTLTSLEAKKAGRNVELRPNWEEVKLPTMELLVARKFENPELAALLLATGDQELVEGNWWGDRFFGVCRGEGENHLGKILMAVREKLKNK